MVIYAQYAHRVGVRLQFLRKGYGKSRFDSGILLVETVGFVRSAKARRNSEEPAHASSA